MNHLHHQEHSSNSSRSVRTDISSIISASEPFVDINEIEEVPRDVTSVVVNEAVTKIEDNIFVVLIPPYEGHISSSVRNNISIIMGASETFVYTNETEEVPCDVTSVVVDEAVTKIKDRTFRNYSSLSFTTFEPASMMMKPVTFLSLDQFTIIVVSFLLTLVSSALKTIKVFVFYNHRSDAITNHITIKSHFYEKSYGCHFVHLQYSCLPITRNWDCCSHSTPLITSTWDDFPVRSLVANVGTITMLNGLATTNPLPGKPFSGMTIMSTHLRNFD